MKRKLLDISGKIDSLTVAIYEQITSVAKSRDIKYFVVGATARDLVLHYGFGIEARRATKGIDLAIQVSNCLEFDQFKKGLIEERVFNETRMPQRLIYKRGIPVDIIPFGVMNENDGSTSWPPEHEVTMNVVGFTEAFYDAMLVRLSTEEELDVLVASPASLAGLKLIAWKNRAPGNIKDAIDLNFIIRSYLDAGNNERLYVEHADLIDDDFDYIRTGASLLGRDIANIFSKDTLSVLKLILNEQTAEGYKYLLVENMSGDGSSECFKEDLDILRALIKGISGKA